MKKTLITLSAGAMLAAVAGTAFAERGERPNPDADGDGAITRAEMQQHGAQMFARMDANGDGRLDQADREAHRQAMFARADADGDGELSQAEMQAMHEARKQRREDRRAAGSDARRDRMGDRFARLDTDDSGGLSQDELRAGHQAHGDRRGEGANKRAHRGMRGAKGGPGGHAMLRTADTDGDGAVSRAEFDAAIAARFARMDGNGDGSVSEAEHEAAREAMRGERKARRDQRRATEGA